MKVIHLLNKIANGEDVPKKIKWEDIIYSYSEYDKDYLEYSFSDEEYKGLFCMKDSILTQYLNDEIEIIEDTPKEDKKIEKLNEYVDIGSFTNQIGIEDNLGFVHWSNDLKEGLDKQTNFNKNVLYKINEIIDKVNGDSDDN